MAKRTQEFATYAVKTFRAPDGFTHARHLVLRDYEQWQDQDGKFHRQNGPACIMYDIDTGIAVRESWYQHGKHHRTDGPAVVVRDGATGHLRSTEWYVDNEEVARPTRSRAKALAAGKPGVSLT